MEPESNRVAFLLLPHKKIILIKMMMLTTYQNPPPGLIQNLFCDRILCFFHDSIRGCVNILYKIPVSSKRPCHGHGAMAAMALRYQQLGMTSRHRSVELLALNAKVHEIA